MDGLPVEPGPVEPRPAATVVLVRPRAVGDGTSDGNPGTDGVSAPDGALEVLLTKRPSSMAFAPDMHVFPGGRVDAGDADPRLTARSVVTATEAAEALGGDLAPADALAAYIAAIREVFEETGVLLADPAPRPRELEVARAEALHVDGAFAPMVDALDLRLRTDLLVPLSRWVTPPNLPRRFDARFFAAPLPPDAEVRPLGDEVVAHAWHTPREALDAMAAGELGMWLPTSSTLQQLEHVRSIDEIRTRLAPGRLGDLAIDDAAAGVIRITMPAGGGVAGQPVCSYLVGTIAGWIVDPGDPTGPGLEAAIAAAEARGTQIAGIALTHADPDHASGAEALRERLDVPVAVGPGGGHDLPFAVTEIDDGTILDAGALVLRVVSTPGPRPDHLAFVVEDARGAPIAVLAGDLDGRRGARSLPGPADDAAWAGSVARLRSAARDAPWLGGHPPSGPAS